MSVARSFRTDLPQAFLETCQAGILDELNLTERYQGGPNRAIRTFFDETPDIFEIDTDLCDMFGPNATYAPNGYLRRSEAAWNSQLS